MARWVYLLAVPLALGPLEPPVTFAQAPPAAPTQAAPAQPAAAPAAQTPEFSQAELEQILAPIALYPDDLLTQILIASTYPLEIVMANRWVQQPANKALKGDALVKALDAQDWDPSVKSLVPFPDVLKTMSDQLDWTQKVGDAFLAQQSEVLASVQALGGRAQSAGKLESNKQQTVTQQGSTIVIQPAQVDTVYVPAYNPSVVYGTWPYPSYPPAYYPPPVGYYPGAALATGLAFGAGIAITGALWGWGSANWGGGNVNINANRFNQINANRGAVTSGTWQHNAAHRRGVGYTNAQVRQQYRPNAGNNAAARDAFRGRAAGQGGLGQGGLGQGGRGQGGQRLGGAGGGNLQRPAGGGGLAQNRPQTGQRPGGGLQGGQRPGGGFQGGQRQGGFQGGQRAGGGGAPAFRGVGGNGAATRAQSRQGAASRGGARAGGGGGGFSRGGGGGGAARGGGGRGGGGRGGGGRGGRR